MYVTWIMKFLAVEWSSWWNAMNWLSLYDPKRRTASWASRYSGIITGLRTWAALGTRSGVASRRWTTDVGVDRIVHLFSVCACRWLLPLDVVPLVLSSRFRENSRLQWKLRLRCSSKDTWTKNYICHKQMLNFIDSSLIVTWIPGGTVQDRERTKRRWKWSETPGGRLIFNHPFTIPVLVPTGLLSFNNVPLNGPWKKPVYGP